MFAADGTGRDEQGQLWRGAFPFCLSSSGRSISGESAERALSSLLKEKSRAQAHAMHLASSLGRGQSAPRAGVAPNRTLMDIPVLGECCARCQPRDEADRGQGRSMYFSLDF